MLAFRASSMRATDSFRWARVSSDIRTPGLPMVAWAPFYNALDMERPVNYRQWFFILSS